MVNVCVAVSHDTKRASSQEILCDNAEDAGFFSNSLCSVTSELLIIIYILKFCEMKKTVVSFLVLMNR